MAKIITFIILAFCFQSSLTQSSSSNLIITPLTGDFYVYTTFGSYQGSRVPANGLYVVTRDGVILIDTPWDTTQFQPLLDTIQHRHNKPVVLCVSTHFHDDRTAGLEYYRSKGIRTYTSKATDALSEKRGMKRAQYLFEKDTVFTVGQYSFEAVYPGEGHTSDNIVIWFERERILHGGCLIKSFKDTTLGNLADANKAEYANTIMRVQAKCKKPAFVIPGHNDWSEPSSLQHTLDMARQLKTKP